MAYAATATPEMMMTLIERIEVLEKVVEKYMGEPDAKPEKPAKKMKTKKEGEVKEKSEKKKRGITGYLVFARYNREDAKECLMSEGNDTPKPTEVITEVAKWWKLLEEHEREEWNERAKQENMSKDRNDLCREVAFNVCEDAIMNIQDVW